MRRVVLGLVILLAGAIAYGWSGLSSGISVNGQRIDARTLGGELAAISQHLTLQCYVTALSPTNYGVGAGGDTVKATGAAAWTELRVEGVAIDQYVQRHLHYTPSAADLASAKASLEGEMTVQAQTNRLTCPGTSAQALAEMPAEMRQAELVAQADSLYLVGKLKKAIPLTAAAMRRYYDAHQSSYDTLCVSIALVSPAKVAAFAASQKTGMSVANLARTYSLDPSSKKGGAYGCYPPTDQSYAAVRNDVAKGTLDAFPTTPQYITYGGQTYAFYVALTKRTPTPFASATPAVLNDLKNLNATAAASVKNTLLYEAAVHVDPAFGRWGLASSGPTVFSPATPSASDVTGASTLGGAAASYR
ncbi:MAG TPA: hypothetical protein PLS29_09090 [Acidimicrobiales bacterium]|nr:MAG: hypothetical protein B7Z69_04760 [Actinobacteria bacterium 21-73-9]HQU27168.1 hypothetical protein [Acidimicrobiales bacterium]